MSSFSDYTENLVLNYLLTANSVTRPTAWYVGLFTAAPSDTGGGTEVSGNGYARKATGTMSVAGTATTATNAAAIEFSPASGGNWGTLTHAAVFDALTGGNMLAWAPLTTSRTINDGDVFRIPASSLTVTLT
ncbi:putative minor tail protein [Caudoviricetes sp.]|nr:putative minor tail protein [Caudoviricetes sp.]